MSTELRTSLITKSYARESGYELICIYMGLIQSKYWLLSLSSLYTKKIPKSFGDENLEPNHFVQVTFAKPEHRGGGGKRMRREGKRRGDVVSAGGCISAGIGV